MKQMCILVVLLISFSAAFAGDDSVPVFLRTNFEDNDDSCRLAFAEVVNVLKKSESLDLLPNAPESQHFVASFRSYHDKDGASVLSVVYLWSIGGGVEMYLSDVLYAVFPGVEMFSGSLIASSVENIISAFSGIYHQANSRS